MTALGKYHGLGNDFLVALEEDNPGLEIDSDLAVRLCDRRTGVGADGLILASRADDAASDAAMTLLNSDGSPAEISGNGIRCMAQAVLRSRGAGAAGRPLHIETPAGTREVLVEGGDPDGEMWMDVDMGAVAEGPEPTAATLAYPAQRVATLALGNPHLVVLVDDPASIDLAVDGPALEAGYPLGINVSFIRALGADRVEMRVWERGAGITEACGSGATAAAAAAIAWGAVSGRVAVEMPGGSVEVELRGTRAHLIGPSTFVAEVIVP